MLFSRKRKQKQSGFSTIEILVAFAVIVLTLSAVITLIFGSQFLLTDAQTTSQALQKAQDLIEDSRATSLADFNAVNPLPAVSDGIYQKSLEVEQSDFYSKKVTAVVSWGSNSSSRSVELSTLLTNWQEALSGNTCNSVLTGDWTKPQINSYDLGQDLIGDSSGANIIADVDANSGKLYVVLSSTTNKTDPTFFVFDISHVGQKPTLLTSLDNDSKVLAGLSAVRVAGNYAYVASQSSYSRGQLQILDISQTPPQILSTFKIPVTNSGGSAKGLGSSIFYHKGLVYLGLSKTDSENEFNIIDVTNPASPVWQGGFDLDSGINALNVKGNYVYLAHPTNSSSQPQEQLTVLDITNSSSPQRVGGFYYNGSSGGNGKSLYLVSDKLFFGRTASKISGSSADSIPELYILDNSNPSLIPPTFLGSLPLATPQSLNAILVRDYLAFLLTTSELQIWNISNPSSISQWGSSISLPGNSVVMDCEGNYLYLASTPATNKSVLSIISPGP